MITTPKSIKGTETEKNLLKSFAGESQARNRYTMFAEVAQKEGYEQIAAIFLETAENELTHAKAFFSFLDEGMLEITASYPAGPISTTERNLAEAAAGEHEEWSAMYIEFAQKAADEGFPKIAALFKGVAKVEQAHEARYLELLDRVKTGTVFSGDNPEQQWQCRYCGYVCMGKSAPKMCPVCFHPQGWFERKQSNY